MTLIEPKTAKSIYFTAIFGVSFFLLIISFFLIKASVGGVCGSDYNYNLPITESSSLTDTIDSYDYLVQSVSFDNKNIGFYESYIFCFNGVVNSTSTIELGVVNIDGDLLAKGYFINSSGIKCLDLGKKSFLVNNNFLGVKCLDCDVSNTLTLYGGVSSVEPTISSGGVVVSETLDYRVIGVKNCYSMVFSLLRYLFGYFFLNVLIFLIIIFVNWLKGFVLDDF